VGLGGLLPVTALVAPGAQLTSRQVPGRPGHVRVDQAHLGRALAGYLRERQVGADCEILTLHADEQWHGTGTALIEATGPLAWRQGVHPLVGHYHQRQR